MSNKWLLVSRIGLVVLGLVNFSACAGRADLSRPIWIDGGSAIYPLPQYLVGVGSAETRTVAEDRAYAAISRIFKAEVSAHAKDWESYLVIEQRGDSIAERRLTLESVTRVATDKVLENVRILEQWSDAYTGLHYALAGMQRSQAETVFLERIALLDQSINDDVVAARLLSDNIATVRALRRALRNLILREAYNADLRIIRSSGEGRMAAYRVSELSRDLEGLLAKLVLAVTVTGDQAEPVQRALTEGLLQEGLHVIRQPWGPSFSQNSEFGKPSPELLVQGAVKIWPIDVGDPYFLFMRWCSDIEVIDLTTQRVIGVLSMGGKEGHLSASEVTAKVVRGMQQTFTADVAKAIAAHVYGELELPAAASRLSGCPQLSARSPVPH